MTRQQGHGLLLALVVLVVTMSALALLAASLSADLWEVRREIRTVNLVALTDAVMAETLAHLAVDERFTGVAERPFGDGLIASEVSSLGSRTVEVLARAAYGGRERTMRGEVQLILAGPRVVRWERVR